jgi:hypothetical protein
MGLFSNMSLRRLPTLSAIMLAFGFVPPNVRSS